MNTISQIPRKSVTGFIKDMLDGWRKIHGWSQSAVVAQVVEAHKAIDAERSTEIVFEEERRGRDLTHCQRINMQRVYRWLDTEDGPGNMPVNVLPSVLAALPIELRIELANLILEPAGLAARPMGASGEGFDPGHHVQTLLKELPEAKKAAFDLTRCDSDDTLHRAHVEAIEAKRAVSDFVEAVEGEMARRGTLRRVA